MSKLTPKQEEFCRQYLIDQNGTQAAIRAGYAERTANVQASRLLTKVNIQNRIAELTERRNQRTDISQDRVLHELANLALYDIANYVNLDTLGVVQTLQVKQLDELTPDQRAAIVGIKQTQNGIELKLASKEKALELLMKHMGMFAPVKVEQTDKAQEALYKLMENKSPEELREIIEAGRRIREALEDGE